MQRGVGSGLRNALTHLTKPPPRPAPPPVPAGTRSSGVLLGVQVPPEDGPEFEAAVVGLSADFTFNEMSGKARHVFDMFIG